MKRQRRIKIMKDTMRKIRSRGRIDAENRWWVAELLAGRLRESKASSRRGRNHAKMA